MGGGAPTARRWCNGNTRYYIDCMQYCCGPRTGYQNFCAGLHGVPLRGRLRHAQGVLQLLPLRAVSPGDRRDRPDRVPGRHVRAAVPQRGVRVQHRGRRRPVDRASTAPACLSSLPCASPVLAAGWRRDRVPPRQALRRRAQPGRRRRRADVQRLGWEPPVTVLPAIELGTRGGGQPERRVRVRTRVLQRALLEPPPSNSTWEGQQSVPGALGTSRPTPSRSP